MFKALYGYHKSGYFNVGPDDEESIQVQLNNIYIIIKELKKKSTE